MGAERKKMADLHNMTSQELEVAIAQLTSLHAVAVQKETFQTKEVYINQIHDKFIELGIQLTNEVGGSITRLHEAHEKIMNIRVADVIKLAEMSIESKDGKRSSTLKPTDAYAKSFDVLALVEKPISTSSNWARLITARTAYIMFIDGVLYWYSIRTFNGVTIPPYRIAGITYNAAVKENCIVVMKPKGRHPQMSSLGDINSKFITAFFK